MNDIKSHAGPIVIAHYAKGETTPLFHVMGANVRMLVIDENVPNDRVYEITSRAHPKVLDELLQETETVGHADDQSAAQERAEQLFKRVASGRAPLPHYLRVVK